MTTLLVLLVLVSGQASVQELVMVNVQACRNVGSNIVRTALTSGRYQQAEFLCLPEAPLDRLVEGSA